MRFTPSILRCPSCAIDLPADLSDGERPGPFFCAACIKAKPPVDASFVAVSYSYPWAGLLTRYKFNDHPGWAGFLASLLLKTPGVHECLSILQPGDVILPLPLSPQRLQQRGFNQAWELASALVSRIHHRGTPDPHLLLRVRDTPPQTELGREARLANVRGAFMVDPLRTQELGGRRVVLVDDVMTSGASLFAAAAALRDAGAAHVTALAFARTPSS